MTLAIVGATFVGLIGIVAGAAIAINSGNLLLGVLLAILGGSLVIVTVAMLGAHVGGAALHDPDER